MMTKLHILAVPALALTMIVPEAFAQRGGAVRTGMRGAVVGQMVGGDAGAQTGAKVGVVTGATRAAVDREAQRRAEYQATTAYQTAPHSDFAAAPPQVLAAEPAAVPAPVAPPAPPVEEAVLQKGGRPVLGITYPRDWKQTIGDSYVSAVSADGQAYSMVSILQGATDKQTAVAKIKKGLDYYLQDVKYDEQTDTKRGGIVITGTGKGKKSGLPVVFAAGIVNTGANQFAGAAFVVDDRIDDYYKETVRQICETLRVGDQLAEKR